MAPARLLKENIHITMTAKRVFTVEKYCIGHDSFLFGGTVHVCVQFLYCAMFTLCII